MAHPLRRWERGVVVRRGVAAVVAVVVAWCAALIVWRDGWWPLVLVNQVAVPGVFWVAGAAWLAALAGRWWALAAVATVPVVLLGVMHQPYLRPGAAAAGEPDLRVMSYNVLNDNDDIDAMVAVVAAVDPDVVAMQELTWWREDEIIDAMAATHPYAVVARPNRGGTTALFSTRPLQDPEVMELGVDRPAVVATVEVDGQPVTVMSAHLFAMWYAFQGSWTDIPSGLDAHRRGQWQEAEAIVAEADRRPGPFILACDCNTGGLNRTNQILAAALRDPVLELGRPADRAPAGMVHDRRLRRVDYVWYRPGDGLVPHSVHRVLDRGGSDHEAVVASFGL